MAISIDERKNISIYILHGLGKALLYKQCDKCIWAIRELFHE